MLRRCADCEAEITASWQYCAWCGARLIPDDRPEESRTVTLVISDLQGSTALAETLDPESLRSVLDRYFDELGAVFEAHGGHIEKRIGDAMVIAFGVPTSRDDDAVQAIQAAAEAQRRLANLNEHLHSEWGVRLVNRTGIATGTVVYATSIGVHRVLAGDAMNTASELEPLAPPLGVLVSVETVEIVGNTATFGPTQLMTTQSGRVVAARQLLTTIATSPHNTDRTIADPVTCGGCGTPRVPDATWCTACGLPLTRSSRRGQSRRTLTIVFADLSISRATSRVTPSDERAAMLRAFDAARGILEHHGGTVENFIGDAVMAVYGLDRRHEDDGLRAVRAAVEVQTRLGAMQSSIEREFGVRLTVKIGVNTGPVIAGDPNAGERLVTGDAVNVAARLEQAATPGDVVIGDLTRQLAGPTLDLETLDPLTLKGKAEPVPAYRVSGIIAGRDVDRGFELPVVGRERELAQLRACWSTTRQHERRQRLTILGEAGSGKSRLVQELLDGMGNDGLVLRGSCLPYGEGITFWPIIEIIRSAAHITTGDDRRTAVAALETISPDHEVALRLEALLGLDDRTVPVPEIFWAVRRLFEHLSTAQPLVVVVDGLHWAEPTLHDLLDDVIAHGGPVPVLLITMARPVDEAIEGKPQQVTDAHHTIRLYPLDDHSCDELIRRALGDETLPDTVRERFVRASGGVPLFVEQLIAMLMGDGRLIRDGDRWWATASTDDLTVPPTVEALVAARIDALDDDERRVLESASVVGPSFPSGAVGKLARSSDVASELSSLAQRQMIASLGIDDPLADHRFENLMIRDVAYDGLLKRIRSQLHREYAAWMRDTVPADRITEVEEILGYHLERAYLLGAEVATVDDLLVGIGREAARHLGAAGERSFARGDMPAAANLLERAARALYGGGSRAAELLVLAGDATMETGAFAAAGRLYTEARGCASDAGDSRSSAAAELAGCTMEYLTGDTVDEEAALALVAHVLPTFVDAGDHAGIARCWRLRAYVDMTACRWGAAEQAAIETIHHAQLAGDHVLLRRVIPALGGFGLFGPAPVPEALKRCEGLLADAGDDIRASALIQQFVARLLALDGHFDEARQRCIEARSSLVELGWNFDAALVAIHLGPIEVLAGDDRAAEATLRAAYDGLRDMGEQNYLSTTAALLAEVARRQGRLEEAEKLAAEAAGITAPDDVFTQFSWRCTRMKVLSARNEHDDAIAIGYEVLELTRSTDSTLWQGESLADVAAVMSAAGRGDEAVRLAADALACFRAKGARTGIDRAERLLETVTIAASATLPLQLDDVSLDGHPDADDLGP